MNHIPSSADTQHDGVAHEEDHQHGGSCRHHRHGTGHHHVHAPASYGMAFAIGIILNSVYIAGETVYGLLAHSLSLLADAGHNLSDVLGLGAAWLAQWLAQRAPSTRFTYGLKRATILTALGNATILLLVTGAILWQTLQHFIHPETVHGTTVSLVAFVGILVNAGTALLFLRGASHDLNIRGAFLHMASDAVMAFAVVVAGGIITLTGWNIVDPIVSAIVSIGIIWSTWSLLTQSLDLALDAVPAGIALDDVQSALRALPGVSDIHHLHVWPLSTTETALTVHLVQDENAPVATESSLLSSASHMLHTRFAIAHATFQIERPADACTTGNCHAPHTH